MLFRPAPLTKNHRAFSKGYEVDLDLYKKQIQLRYDPFDLIGIQVWHEGKRYADATVVDLARPYDHRVKPENPALVVYPMASCCFWIWPSRSDKPSGQTTRSPMPKRKQGMQHE